MKSKKPSKRGTKAPSGKMKKVTVSRGKHAGTKTKFVPSLTHKRSSGYGIF